MTAWVLVPVLRSWRRRFPDVEFGLKEFSSADQMLEVLLRGETDITVGPRPTRTDEHVELLGQEETVVVAAPDHRFAALDTVPLAELAAEPLVHYDPGNGFGVWVDEFAAQLAVAGMGVAIVPASALTPRPDGTIRPFDPPEMRDVIVVVSAPHDDLVRRFVSDLKRRGLPDWRAAHHNGSAGITEFDKAHQFFETR